MNKVIKYEMECAELTRKLIFLRPDIDKETIKRESIIQHNKSIHDYKTILNHLLWTVKRGNKLPWENK